MSKWQTVPLSEVAIIERSGIQPEMIKDGTIYIGLEHIEKGGRFTEIKSVDTGDLASSKFHFTEKHILYGKLRPYLAKIACPEFKGICSTDILPILPTSNIDRKFLFHFLRQPKMVDYANSQAVGVNLPRLSPSVLAKFEVPLPPIAEQKHIAEILDRTQSLISKRKEAIVKLDTLTQSIFLEMFGDPIANSKGWTIQPLKFFVFNVTNGLTRRRKESDQGRDIVLRLRDIRNGWIDFSNVNRISLDTSERSRYETTVGDLLFIRVNGNPDYVGRCAIFDGFGESVYFNDHIMRVKIDQSKVNSKFLSFLLNGERGKKEIASYRKTSAGQHTINQEGLNKITLPVPPLPLQKEFAQRVEAVEKLKATHRASLSQLQALFASLQHRAFRGEL